jgi:hypothetical protein
MNQERESVNGVLCLKSEIGLDDNENGNDLVF